MLSSGHVHKKIGFILLYIDQLDSKRKELLRRRMEVHEGHFIPTQMEYVRKVFGIIKEHAFDLR
jgi:hypothetical protein